MFPELFHTPRLALRPVALTDAEPIFNAYAQDPDVTRFLTWRPHTTITETRDYIAHCLTAASARTYVLISRQDETLLGAFDLRQTGPNRFGFGYVLAQRSWGQGLMTEVLSNVTTWALNQSDIWRIGDVCDCENLASVRVMEKAGLVREGILRRWTVHPNISRQPRDCISFAKVN